MKRLRKLEGIVEELSGQIEVETARNHSSSGNSPEATVNNSGDQNTPSSGHRLERADSIAAGSAHSQGSPLQAGEGRPSPYNFNSSSGNLLQRQDSVNKKFGRLVINDHGRTRYVSSAFWSKITDEVGAVLGDPGRSLELDSGETDRHNSSTNCEMRPSDLRMQNLKNRTTRVSSLLPPTARGATTMPFSWDTDRPMSTYARSTPSRLKYPICGRCTRKTWTRLSRSYMYRQSTSS